MSHALGLLGFGELGQILASDLHAARIGAFDPLFADRDSAPSLALPGAVQAFTNPRALAAEANLIISCVTAANTGAAANSIIDALAPNAWFLDLNSASPGVKRAAADAVTQAGGRYIEASVMSPISPKRLDAPILLGGPNAEAFAPIAASIGFTNISVFSNEYGPTAAVKMCRSVIVKGVEALLTESLICARTHGVEADVLASLSDLFPGPDWRKLAHYMISRSLDHGVRRAEEMREAARTIAEAGLDPIMSTAIAKRQDWAGAQSTAAGAATLEAMLDALVEAARNNDGNELAR